MISQGEQYKRVSDGALLIICSIFEDECTVFAQNSEMKWDFYKIPTKQLNFHVSNKVFELIDSGHMNWFTKFSD
jgi:hypothetical protein